MFVGVPGTPEAVPCVGDKKDKKIFIHDDSKNLCIQTAKCIPPKRRIVPFCLKPVLVDKNINSTIKVKVTVFCFNVPI